MDICELVEKFNYVFADNAKAEVKDGRLLITIANITMVINMPSFAEAHATVLSD